MAVTISYPYQPPEGGTDLMKVTGADLAAAQALFTKKLKITAGVDKSGIPTYTTQLTPPTNPFSSAIGHKATLRIRRNGKTRNLPVNNMLRSLFDSDGKLIMPSADTADFVANWQDGNGNTGYVLVGGKMND